MDQPPPAALKTILLLAAAAILIVLSMLFSASESAFLSLNKLRVRFLQDKKNKSAIRVAKLLEKKEELLNTLLVANNIVNIMLSAILTTVALEIFGSKGVGIATAVATVLLLLYGEITPKTVATKHPEKVAFALCRFIYAVSILLHPFVVFFTFISRSVLHLLGVKADKKNVSFTEEEIKTLIDVGGEEGIIEENENTMMNRVFKFTDLSAAEIMVPRRSVVALNPEMSYREILQISERTRLSRFPVAKNGLDDIIGFLYVKDLMTFADRQKEFSVVNAMRPPLFIPGTTKTSSIQQILRENKQSFAVVIDEYSGTDGILTTEDISREIFGTIADGTHQKGSWTAENVEVLKDDLDNTFIDGATRLLDLEEKLHVELPSRGNETIAGLVLEHLGHIPQNGESIFASGYKFTVDKMDGLRISRLLCQVEKTEE